MRGVSVCAAGVVLACAACAQPADWTEPFPPHKVIGNVYYVGSRGLASYLVTTPAGHILINSSLVESVPLIRQNIEKLGFRFGDVKILLISHAHWDHCAGSARIKELTGAQYMVMNRDAPEIEAGGKGNFQYGNDKGSLYPPARVDRVLGDGDRVTLGDAVLTAHLTPGHTKGCTTWTLDAPEGGKAYHVVIVGSPNVNAGYRLVNNRQYPEIAQDYERTFRVLRALACDVFLGAHGSYYNLEKKYPLVGKAGRNPFIDPQGYRSYVEERENAFRTEWKKQQGGR